LNVGRKKDQIGENIPPLRSADASAAANAADPSRSEERRKRALADPEINMILADPMVNQVLSDAQKATLRKELEILGAFDGGEPRGW
jgi:hypothetical protein